MDARTKSRTNAAGVARTTSTTSTAGCSGGAHGRARLAAGALFLASTALGGCAFDVVPSAEAATSSQAPLVTAGTHVLRGAVRGLHAVGLVLENNRSDAIALSKDGIFVFQTALERGTVFAVTVAQEPEGQTCRVTDGLGVVEGDDVSSVTVACVDDFITVGGTISGLRSSVILENGADAVSVVGDGRFFLPTKLGPGKSYAIAVATQPNAPPQTCTVVERGNGMTIDHDIGDVRVICAEP